LLALEMEGARKGREKTRTRLTPGLNVKISDSDFLSSEEVMPKLQEIRQ